MGIQIIEDEDYLTIRVKPLKDIKKPRFYLPFDDLLGLKPLLNKSLSNNQIPNEPFLSNVFIQKNKHKIIDDITFDEIIYEYNFGYYELIARSRYPKKKVFNEKLLKITAQKLQNLQTPPKAISETMSQTDYDKIKEKYLLTFVFPSQKYIFTFETSYPLYIIPILEQLFIPKIFDYIQMFFFSEEEARQIAKVLDVEVEFE